MKSIISNKLIQLSIIIALIVICCYNMNCNNFNIFNIIISGLLNAGIIGIIVFLLKDYFKVFLINIFEDRKGVITYYYDDIEECLKYMYEAIQKYQNNYQKANITIATPLLFSPEYFSYVYPDDIEKAHRCLRYANEINHIIRGIIDNGDRGSYDKILLGKTNDILINNATYKLWNELYFSKLSDYLLNTTEMGIHPNLNENATFIFADIVNDTNPSMPGKYHFIMQINFSQDFKHVVGFTCNDSDISSKLYAFVNLKIRDAKKNNKYLIFNESDKPDVNDINDYIQSVKDHFVM